MKCCIRLTVSQTSNYPLQRRRDQLFYPLNIQGVFFKYSFDIKKTQDHFLTILLLHESLDFNLLFKIIFTYIKALIVSYDHLLYPIFI